MKLPGHPFSPPSTLSAPRQLRLRKDGLGSLTVVLSLLCGHALSPPDSIDTGSQGSTPTALEGDSTVSTRPLTSAEPQRKKRTQPAEAKVVAMALVHDDETGVDPRRADGVGWRGDGR